MNTTFFGISRFSPYDATARSKISTDQNRFFIALSLYPLYFFGKHSLSWIQQFHFFIQCPGTVKTRDVENLTDAEFIGVRFFLNGIKTYSKEKVQVFYFKADGPFHAVQCLHFKLQVDILASFQGHSWPSGCQQPGMYSLITSIQFRRQS